MMSEEDPDDFEPQQSHPAAAATSSTAPSTQQPLQVLVRSPTVKKSYKLRTPVTVALVERVFGLHNPYLVSAKTKTAVAPDAEGIYHLPPAEADFIVMGQTTKSSPSASAVTSAVTSASSASANTSARQPAKQGVTSSSSPPRVQRQPSPTPLPSRDGRGAEKNGWDDMEEDFAEPKTGGFPFLLSFFFLLPLSLTHSLTHFSFLLFL